MLQTKLCCTQLCENLMTFCSGPYKVTGPFGGTEKRLNRAWTQPQNTAKMKPKINLLVLMCLQQTQSRQIWKSGCFQEADMVIVPLSSLWAGSSLSLQTARYNHPTPSPSSAQVTQPWYHSAACGWLPPSIIHSDGVRVWMLCCSLWCPSGLHINRKC